MATIYNSLEIVPTQAEFEKLLTAKNSYENAAKKPATERDAWNKKHFNMTPWGIGYNLSKKKHNMAVNNAKAKAKDIPDEPTAKLLRYYIIAVVIDWQELIIQLKRTLAIWGYSTADIKQMAFNVWQNSPVTDKIIDALMYAQKSNAIELVESIEKHNTLNSKLFTKDDVLKETVRKKMLEIVDTFIDNLKEQKIKIKVDDILFIGSNASYNYTKNSDVDLHIIANTKSVDYPEELGNALYSAYRSLFNKSYDISFYDIPLEIFVETEDTPKKSNGIYSVKKDKWLKKPVKEDIPEYDKKALEALVTKWETKCAKLINDIKADKLEDEQKVLNLIEDIYEKLRKKGIAKGEYAIENLAFKELRNKGYLDDLKTYRDELISKRLSLIEKVEEQKVTDKQNQVIKIAKKYKPEFTSNQKFILADLDEKDFKAIYNKLANLPYVTQLNVTSTNVINSLLDNVRAAHGILPAKKYTIKGNLK